MAAFTNKALPSTAEQIRAIAESAVAYSYLPFASDSVPGAYVEAVVANVRGGEVLNTYDFVDVVDRQARVGWQVKSTKASTPVTWKRAKIPNALELIDASRGEGREIPPSALQALGDAVIAFCNEHANASLTDYDLDAIGYSRILVRAKEIVYFERELVTVEQPKVFEQSDFTWKWSVSKKARPGKKEQLSALHGFNADGRKCFAWHGLGENQLHYSGESLWWPPEDDPHSISVPLPEVEEKLTFEDFVEILSGSIEPRV